MAEVHFLDACAISQDFLYVASQLDDVDPREVAHTRMCTYFSKDGTWFSHDVEMNAISVAVKINHANDSEDRRLISLSTEGEIDIFAKGDYVWSTEKIPEAGVRLGKRGRMTHIRQIGAHLFACGHNGQIYQRNGSADWCAIDEGVYKAAEYSDSDDAEVRAQVMLDAIMNKRILNCIDGNSEQDIYVVGDSGYMAHYDGKAWSQIELQTDEHLQWIRCYGANEVWACGYNGTLLKGSVTSGFKDVSSIDDNDTWWCLVKHEEEVYLSATSGLFRFDSTSTKIARVSTGLKPEVEDTYRLDAKDGALWSMGEKDIVRFYKGNWERIHHIDNPPVEE